MSRIFKQYVLVNRFNILNRLFIDECAVDRRELCSLTEERVIKSPYTNVALPEIPLPRFVWDNVDRWPHHIAVECAFSGKKYTYSQLHKKCMRLASSLKKLGLHPGDAISIVLPNIPEFPISFLGSLESGLVPFSLNPALTKDELIDQMSRSDIKCVICHPKNIKTINDVRNEMRKDMKIIITHNIDGTAPADIGQNGILFEDAISDWIELSDSYDAKPDDTAITVFSSGTTGLPKATLLSHKAFSSSLSQLSSPSVQTIFETHGIYQDIVPGVIPFFHIYGNGTAMMNALSKGAKLITFPRFDKKEFLNVLQNNMNIVLYVVPPLIFYMGNAEEVTCKHLEGVRQIVTAAAPCSKSDIDKIRNKSATVVYSQGYGLTESTTFLTVGTQDESTQESTVGQLLPNNLGKVIDVETGACLPPNTPGEFIFKSSQVMKGYLNNPEATKKMLDSEGWLHTGDIGYYDDNGYFFITDRIKDIIKVKGYQVAPAEIEGVLRKHPNILDAGVTGIPCKTTGETPIAFVQLKPGTKLSEHEVIEFLSAHLTKYKLVSSVNFVETIPKTPSGKILRKQLREVAM